MIVRILACQTVGPAAAGSVCRTRCYVRDSGARFTKYLTAVLRLSYDNAKVTIDLRRTSNLQNILYEGRKAILGYDSLAKL